MQGILVKLNVQHGKAYGDGDEQLDQPIQFYADDTLIAEGSQNMTGGSTTPNGVQVAKTFYFTKDIAELVQNFSLQNATIIIPGNEQTGKPNETYYVIGDPRPYEAGMTPTPWVLAVEASAERI